MKKVSFYIGSLLILAAIVLFFLNLDKESAGNKENSVIEIFFSNSKLDPEMMDCSKVYSAYRPIVLENYYSGRVTSEEEKLMQKIYFAVSNLLAGPTDEETREGFFTSINKDSKINSINIEGGVVKVDFSQEFNTGVAGSCRVIAIRSQVEETLKQFPEVKNVIISVDGNSENLLQP